MSFNLVRKKGDNVISAIPNTKEKLQYKAESEKRNACQHLINKFTPEEAEKYEVLNHLIADYNNKYTKGKRLYNSEGLKKKKIEEVEKLLMWFTNQNIPGKLTQDSDGTIHFSIDMEKRAAPQLPLVFTPPAAAGVRAFPEVIDEEERQIEAAFKRLQMPR